MTETWNETWWHRDVLCVFCATHCRNFLLRHIPIGSQTLEVLVCELCEQVRATLLTLGFPVLDLQQCWCTVGTGNQHRKMWRSADTVAQTSSRSCMRGASLASGTLALPHSTTCGLRELQTFAAAKGCPACFPTPCFHFPLCACLMQELWFRNSWEISCANLTFWSFKEMNYFKSLWLEWKWRCLRCRKKFVIILQEQHLLLFKPSTQSHSHLHIYHVQD